VFVVVEDTKFTKDGQFFGQRRPTAAAAAPPLHYSFIFS